MITRNEILETNQMIDNANLDVRTITMGISLLDCADADIDKFNEKVYNKITTYAKDLVKVGDELAKEYGVPVVNKRISVTPIAIAAAGCKTDSYVSIAQTLDRAAKAVGVNFIGGFSALVQKGYTESDRKLIASIPEAMAVTDFVCSSVNIGTSRNGINMDAVKEMGEVIHKTAELTKDRECIGCAKLVVFCNAVEDNPFMAGAFHGVGEADCAINVGVSGPGVVKKALEEVRGEDFETLCETVKRTAFKITRVGQMIAREASKRLNVPFGIIDLSLAPTPAVGDSIAEIFQEMGLAEPGAPGTTAALALLNDNVKKGGVMASSYVGGLSGAFIPVSEDHGMDMIAVPGDTTPATLSGIIADEAAIGMVNNKTTAVRLIPVIGRGVGESVEFGGLLGYAPIMAVNKYSCEDFIARGGRIPAPIHSFKN